MRLLQLPFANRRFQKNERNLIRRHSTRYVSKHYVTACFICFDPFEKSIFSFFITIGLIRLVARPHPQSHLTTDSVRSLYSP